MPNALITEDNTNNQNPLYRADLVTKPIGPVLSKFKSIEKG
jgi:hypothetical protein